MNCRKMLIDGKIKTTSVNYPKSVVSMIYLEKSRFSNGWVQNGFYITRNWTTFFKNNKEKKTLEIT